MSYDVELTPEAEDDIRRLADLDPALASHVIDHLEKLSEDPVGLGRRGGFPFRPGQQYSFYSPDRAHRFIVLFRYAPGESRIIILSVGHVHYGP